jgi:6-phospho-beta-glucosidase
MADGLKIVTIGGGSSYTPELVEGFIKRYERLPVRELWLVDIPEGKEKLKIVGNLAKRMVAKAKIPMQIHLTLDRREALKDADFVTTQIRVGGLKARILDESIPLQFGVLGQETNGPGGLFKALRTIPVILDICQDIKELCPDAWLINFTNPAGIVTEAVLRHADHKKVIGLCNLPIGMVMNVAELLQVEQNRVRIDFAGLNHMVYGLRVYLDGQEVTEEVIRLMCEKGSRYSMKNIAGFGWEPEFLKALGALPCPYHRYYYKADEMLADMIKKYREAGKTRAHQVQEVERKLFEIYQDENLNVKPKQLEERGGAYYSDAACSLIDSIYNNRGDLQTVNVQNRGAIAHLPYESAVEISSIITKDGPIPLTMGELPIAAQGLVGQIKAFERLAIEAAVTGDYGTALLAMVTHPLVPSDKIGKQILDTMLEAHRNYLPQFFS